MKIKILFRLVLGFTLLCRGGLRSRGRIQSEPRPTFTSNTRHKPPSPTEPRRGTDIFGYSSATNQNSSPSYVSSTPPILNRPTTSLQPHDNLLIPLLTPSKSNHVQLHITTYSTTDPYTITPTITLPTPITRSPPIHPQAEPTPTINLPRDLMDVPLCFIAEPNPSLSISQSSSTPSTRGRKKATTLKIISIPQKRKLIDETLGASNSPTKCVKPVIL
ncbi:UNVERIFIED_CONTAM: hypothetical protein Sradi_6215800 [Sesamum radiatum]|uniref:Uncharacterized protein n=1 Tax=Sesamum radiatum TaxID=300843 RepID=A0AAW2KAI7_SESRA